MANYITLTDCKGQCGRPDFRPAHFTIRGQELICLHSDQCQAVGCAGTAAGVNPLTGSLDQYCIASQAATSSCTAGATCPRAGHVCNTGQALCYGLCLRS